MNIMKINEVYEKFNSFKTKGEAYKFFKITPNKYGIIKLKEIAKSVNFDLNTYSERRKRHCIICNKVLNKNQRKFCSHSCSAKYGNSHRIISNITKEKISKSLKKTKVKKCKICGQEHCTNREVCNHTILWFNNLTCFGFNYDKIGTIDVYLEYYRIKELLLKEYYDNNLSPNDIAIKYSYNKKSENILHVLKSFNIKTRNLSESESNARLQGKCNALITKVNKYQFKHGWHTTWNNKKIYYRSSYELNFAKKLDRQSINYECEFFRIKYWDSQKNKYRVAVPDFYIPLENKVYEIKSKVTFDKINMIDKFNEYNKIGLIPILILENIEYNHNSIHEIIENRYKFS